MDSEPQYMKNKHGRDITYFITDRRADHCIMKKDAF